MAAAALLERNARPSRDEISRWLGSSLCRCTGYQGIVDAIEWAADGRDGPPYCWTPICVCDFTEEEHRMRLVSVHPGYTVDDVVSNTGFELVIEGEVPQTTPPTDWELQVLRTRVDRGGRLRTRRMTVGE